MKTFTVTYKGGSGKAFAETWTIIKATTKKAAKQEFYQNFGGQCVIKEMREL